jgi:hypothetical protein
MEYQLTQEETDIKTKDMKEVILVNKRVVIDGVVYFEKWFEDGTLFSRIKYGRI